MNTLIGVAQLDNCLDWNKNLKKAKKVINHFSKKGASLVCFQEAFLSGYHGEIFSKDYSLMPYMLKEIRELAYKKKICVFLPTIEKLGKKFVSSVYIFNSDNGDITCYKEGLTPSEKTVMKSKKGKREFLVDGVKFGTIICREMEDNPYIYLNKKSLPDVILWPAYWGWQYHMKWGEFRKSDGKKDKPFSFIKKVKRPLIQINMFQTIRKDMTVEKYGKSVVVNSSNKRVGVGKYGKQDLFLVSYDRGRVSKL